MQGISRQRTENFDKNFRDINAAVLNKRNSIQQSFVHFFVIWDNFATEYESFLHLEGARLLMVWQYNLTICMFYNHVFFCKKCWSTLIHMIQSMLHLVPSFWCTWFYPYVTLGTTIMLHLVPPLCYTWYLSHDTLDTMLIHMVPFPCYT